MKEKIQEKTNKSKQKRRERKKQKQQICQIKDKTKI